MLRTGQVGDLSASLHCLLRGQLEFTQLTAADGIREVCRREKHLFMSIAKVVCEDLGCDQIAGYLTPASNLQG